MVFFSHARRQHTYAIEDLCHARSATAASPAPGADHARAHDARSAPTGVAIRQGTGEILTSSSSRRPARSHVSGRPCNPRAISDSRLARSQGCEPGTPGAEAATPSRRSTILQPKCPLSPPHSACRHEQVHAFAQTSIQYRRLVRCRPPTLGAPRRGRSDHRGIDWTKTKPISRRIASMVLKDAIMPSRTCSYALLLVSLSILLGGILACSASCIRACAQIVTARPL